MKYLYFSSLIFFFIQLQAQDYTSYLVGQPENVSTNPSFGICLMGGASEDDQAMQWFLNKADGGDVVVLRTTGTDGYNDYFYSDLGVSLNSVETLVIHNEAGATHPHVLNAIENAEAIWFAGGNQATYVEYFKDNALTNLLNEHINVKQAPIGGTSAGMAIMGEFYFDAINGSITSEQALNNPFHPNVSIGQGSFLDVPFLTNTITDTHYNNPDRKGRHSVFISRMLDETQELSYGIAADEFVGICIDENGEAVVFGEYPEFDDYAYFIQANCEEDFMPEVLTAGEALTWNKANKAMKVYQLPATSTGNNSFNLSTWNEGNGGEWQAWWVDEGDLFIENTTDFDCPSFTVDTFDPTTINIYPNPTSDFLFIEADTNIKHLKLYAITGQLKWSSDKPIQSKIDIRDLANGIYILEIKTELGILTKKIIKK